GAKAAQKRERNTKNASKGPTSQQKTNDAAKSIICQTCKQAFFITTRQPALEEHSQNKHTKSMSECFPNFGK
ncbi:At2g23090 like protein, partial [Lentinula aciculospora]